MRDTRDANCASQSQTHGVLFNAALAAARNQTAGAPVE